MANVVRASLAIPTKAPAVEWCTPLQPHISMHHGPQTTDHKPQTTGHRHPVDGYGIGNEEDGVELG